MAGFCDLSVAGISRKGIVTSSGSPTLILSPLAENGDEIIEGSMEVEMLVLRPLSNITPLISDSGNESPVLKELDLNKQVRPNNTAPPPSL